MSIEKLPRGFIISVGLAGLSLFAFSWWVEMRHLGFLQQHPIMVNLMSGLVAFCFGIVTIAVGFNWIIERDRASQVRRSLRDGQRAITNRIQKEMERFTLAGEDPVIVANELLYSLGLDDMIEFFAKVDRLPGGRSERALNMLIAAVDAFRDVQPHPESAGRLHQAADFVADAQSALLHVRQAVSRARRRDLLRADIDGEDIKSFADNMQPPIFHRINSAAEFGETVRPPRRLPR